MQHEIVRRWLAVAQNAAEPDWDLFAAPISLSQHLSHEGKYVLLGAISNLRRWLLEKWIAQCWRKDHPFLNDHWSPVNDVPLVYENLLTLALQLELVSKSRGFAVALKQARTDLTYDRWIHFCTQVEMAGYALREGWTVILEYAQAIQPGPDILAERHGSLIQVEITRQGTSHGLQLAEGISDQLMLTLFDIRRRHGVVISGEFGEMVPREQLDVWIPTVEGVALQVSKQGQPRTIGTPGAGTLTISPEAWASPGMVLSGPRVVGDDDGKRLQSRFREKGDQSTGGRPTVLWILETGGLWLFSEWAQAPLDRKIMSLEPLARPFFNRYGHLAVVSVTTGRTMLPTAPANEEVAIYPVGMAALRVISPPFIRGTVTVCSGTDEGWHMAEAVYDWYRKESSFLSWALAETGRPPLDRIFI